MQISEDDTKHKKQSTALSSLSTTPQFTTKKESDNTSEKKFSIPELCNSCIHTQCCTGFASPIVFEKDFENLKSIQKSHHIQTKLVNGKSVKIVEKKKNRSNSNENSSYANACVFWNEQESCCSIYEQRPFDCKMFPFDIYKIDDKYMWVVYVCNENNDDYNNTNKSNVAQSNRWKWSESNLQALEQDPQFEDIIKNIEMYSDRTEINSLEEAKKIEFVILREVNNTIARKQ